MRPCGRALGTGRQPAARAEATSRRDGARAVALILYSPTRQEEKMGDFKTSFSEYYPPSDSAISSIFSSGIICPDANVLLDAYRFNPQTRSELLRVLKSLGSQLWVPHQVALEFHRNRIKAIAGFEAKYREAKSSLQKLKDHYKSDTLPSLRELSKTIALPDQEKDLLVAQADRAIESIDKRIDELRNNHGVSLDSWRKDAVLGELLSIIGGKVGDPFCSKDHGEASAEAARRIQSSEPPGYRDSSKDEPHGDYFIWKQMLTEASQRGKPLLFVTRDEKEDWFRIEKGRTIPARPELIREALNLGVQCTILNTKSFLYHANRALHLTVSSEVISKMGQAPSRKEKRGIPKEARVERGIVEKNLAVLTRSLNRSNSRIAILEKQLSKLQEERVNGDGFDEVSANKLISIQQELDYTRHKAGTIYHDRENLKLMLSALEAEEAGFRVNQKIDLEDDAKFGDLNYHTESSWRNQ